MSLQRDVSEILASLQGYRPVASTNQASMVAEGVRESGLADVIEVSSDRLNTSLAGLGAMVGVSARIIATEIARSNNYLSLVVDTLRDPRATAANERFRAGLNALQKGWLPEAIEEFQESIKLFRFHPATHASLGHALASDDKLADAAESYLLAQRYALPDDPEFAVGCLLLAAGALEGVGQSGRAAELLAGALGAFKEFPEVGVTYARISGDSTKLIEALMVAPGLVVPAMAAGVPAVEEAAHRLAHAPEGPVALAGTFLATLGMILSELPESEGRKRLPTLDAESDLDQLAAAATILDESAGIIATIRQHLAGEQAAHRILGSPPPDPRDELVKALQADLKRLSESRDRLLVEVPRIEALLATENQDFRYYTVAPSDFPVLSSIGVREAKLLDTLGELEGFIRAGKLPMGATRFANYYSFMEAGESLLKLRAQWAEIDANEDPAELRDRDAEAHRARLKATHTKAARDLKDLSAQTQELEVKLTALRGEIETSREAAQVALAGAHEQARIHALRLEELLHDLESIAARKPIRRTPWGIRREVGLTPA